MAQYIDSHCHLSLKEPFDAVFARANTGGIAGCVLNSVNESDWDKIVTISKNNKKVIGGIGIHPWHTDNISQNWADNMSAILQDNPGLIVGEIGLDKMRDNFAAQEKVFIKAIEIAIKYKRTICIHCVHAWDEMLKILKSYKKDLPAVVFHAFDGTQNAIDCDLNCYFSYSPNIAKPNYKKARESVQRVPKNRVLVESDSSELLPTINAANGVLSLRDDISVDDIFNNAMGVFFNG